MFTQATVVGELQHRGGDGDAALLLDVHPVGHGVLGRARLALDGARRLDAAGIEQQLLGKRGLAGVGVAEMIANVRREEISSDRDAMRVLTGIGMRNVRICNLSIVARAIERGQRGPRRYRIQSANFGRYSTLLRLSTMSMQRSLERMNSVTITENTMVRANATIKLGR